MDWSLVDIERLQSLRCPSCREPLGGGLMRQLEWTTRRCVLVIVCPGCETECMTVLEALARRDATPAIDVDEVRRAHELLAERDVRVGDLFAS